MQTQRIETKIRELLQEHNVLSPPVPVDDIARKLGAQVRYLPFKGEGEISGMLFRHRKRPVIGVNSLHHPNRQRFTIAHEIGHMLLHKGSEIYVDKALFSVNLRDDVSSEASNKDEIEANCFAAALLMPKQMLLSDLEGQEVDLENEDDLLGLARKYRVSLQAMTFRLANLGLISLQ
ncbi:MAG: ImmA/IrrE family metallo-endopeptidase [Nitrososphaerales archaeon]